MGRPTEATKAALMMPARTGASSLKIALNDLLRTLAMASPYFCSIRVYVPLS
jgi:hypothetical protein